MSHLLEMQPGENVIMVVHKHWFMLLRDTIGTLIAGLIPIIITLIILGAYQESSSATVPLAFFFSSLWMALMWMALATIWTNYYLDMWIVTDKRIIYIEQVRLFSREITTVRIERIQDASVSFNSFLETILDFGTLRVQSAGAVTDDLEVHGIPHPEEIKQAVLVEVDRQTQKRMKMLEHIAAEPDAINDV